MPFAPVLAMPLDKGADSFGQSGNDLRNDFFDQCLTFDAVGVDGSIYLTAPESTLLVSKAKGSDSADTGSKMWKDGAAQAARLRGELLQDQSPASPNDKREGDAFRFQDSGRAAGPDFGLLSLEKIPIQSRLKSPPPSPELLVNRKTRARQPILEGFHKPFKIEKELKTFRKSTSPIRKATSPAKMRRTPYTVQDVSGWGQQTASGGPGFNYGFRHTGAISPPPSVRVSESSENSNYTMAATQQQNSTLAWDHPISEQYAYRTTEDIDSPLNTPPADNTSFHRSNMRNTSSNNMIYTTSRGDQSSASWVQPSVNPDYTYDVSTPYVDEQEWWANAATTPMAEPAPSGYRRPDQNNSQSLAMQLQAELAYNANGLSLGPSNMTSGLMIQMPNSPAGPYVVGASPIDEEQEYFAPTASASQSLQPHHQYSQSQPQNYAPLPTVRQEKSHGQSRTESFSSSPSPRLHASSTHVSKKHHSHSSGSSHRSKHGSRKSHSSSSSGQKTPKGTSKGTMPVADFVNFTPKDSTKILTGVAPSGSSKTKARREKEAAEKSKRLSQAAVRAVQAAGGSIDTLVEEGLFEGSELEEMS
jgi:hypothetical protein